MIFGILITFISIPVIFVLCLWMLYNYLVKLFTETVWFSWYLEDLDGKQINELSRQFLINWKASKDAKKKLDDGKDIREQISNPLTSMNIFFFTFLTQFNSVFSINELKSK